MWPLLGGYRDAITDSTALRRQSVTQPPAHKAACKDLNVVLTPNTKPESHPRETCRNYRIGKCRRKNCHQAHATPDRAGD